MKTKKVIRVCTVTLFICGFVLMLHIGIRLEDERKMASRTPYNKMVDNRITNIRLGSRWWPLVNKASEEKMPSNITLTVPPSVFLVTTPRSGSTFLGELLGLASPNTFYSYEPLHQWGPLLLTNSDNNTHNAVTFLKDLIQCNFDPHQKEMKYISQASWMLHKIPWIYASCKKFKACNNTSFLSDRCKRSSVIVAKVVRLTLEKVLPLLQDNSLLKVIYMARDPRGTLSSRAGKYIRWCKHPTYRDPEVVCSLLQQDLQLVPRLLQQYPSRFKFVQYEDLSSDIEKVMKEILSFADLPVSDIVVRRLRCNLQSTKVGSAAGTIFRNPLLTALNWRQKLEYSKMAEFQQVCLEPLKMLGLNAFSSEQDYRNLSLPILLPFSLITGLRSRSRSPPMSN